MYRDVPGCTGKHANYKGLLIFLQGIQDYSGMTFHRRMRTFVPGHCRSPRKGRFNCESLTSFSGWPVLSCTEGGKQDMLTAKRVKRTIRNTQIVLERGWSLAFLGKVKLRYTLRPVRLLRCASSTGLSLECLMILSADSAHKDRCRMLQMLIHFIHVIRVIHFIVIPAHSF